MALLELEKLRKDINILFGYVRCLMAKSDETSPLVATEWSSNHTTVTGNPYTAGTYVFYNGHVYKCKFNNDGIIPTNTTYWLDLGEGHLLAEEQSDWNATTGRPFIRNKPIIINDKTYIHNQVVASASWLVQHNLNKYPSVSIVDSGDNVVIGDIQYIDLNNILITFTSTFSGKVYFN